jgi:hypothetical protein
MALIQREGYKILDVRSARDYDDKHITKPARSSLNAPVVLNDNATPNPRFLAEVGAQLGCRVACSCPSAAARGMCVKCTASVKAVSVKACGALSSGDREI